MLPGRAEPGPFEQHDQRDLVAPCQFGKPVPWASISPTTLRLQPGTSERVTVTVSGRPPAGKAETVASFVTTSGHSGVGAQGGVGVAVYTSEPGHAPAPTCHHAAGRNDVPSAAQPASPAAPANPWWLLLAAAMVGAAAAAIIGAVAAAIRRRRRAA